MARTDLLRAKPELSEPDPLGGPTRTINGGYGRYMETGPAAIRVESLGDHAELVEQAGLLRWREWGYTDLDPTSWIEVTAREAGPTGQLPMTLVAIDAAGYAVGVVGLGPSDGEVSAAERGDRAPWILGMVVRVDSRKLGIGRQLLGTCRTSPRLSATLRPGSQPVKKPWAFISAVAGPPSNNYTLSRRGAIRPSSPRPPRQLPPSKSSVICKCQAVRRCALLVSLLAMYSCEIALVLPISARD
jgi:hypothetical protein